MNKAILIFPSSAEVATWLRINGNLTFELRSLAIKGTQEFPPLKSLAYFQ